MSPQSAVESRCMPIGFALVMSLCMSSCSQRDVGPSYVFHFKMTDAEIRALELNDECKQLMVLAQQEALHRLSVRDVVDALRRCATLEDGITTTRYTIPLEHGRGGEGDRVFFVDLEKSGELRVTSAGLAIICS